MTKEQFTGLQLWLGQHIIKDAIIRRSPDSNNFELRITSFANTIPPSANDILDAIVISIPETVAVQAHPKDVHKEALESFINYWAALEVGDCIDWNHMHMLAKEAKCKILKT